MSTEQVKGYYIRLDSGCPENNGTALYLRCISGPDEGFKVVFSSGDEAIEYLNDPKIRDKHPYAHLEPSYKQMPNSNLSEQQPDT